MNRFAVSTIHRCKRFRADQRGATAIEYALIAAGIAGAIVAVIGTLGSSVNDMWTTITDALG